MSEAQEQPKAEAPTAEVETTPTAEAPKAVAETQAVNPAPVVESTVPKKFLKDDGSPDIDRLAKSYIELEKKLSAPAEVAKRKIVSDIPIMSQPTIPEAKVDSDSFYTDPQGVIQNEVKRATAPLEAKLKYNEMSQAEEKARVNLPKFDEWSGEIAEVIKSNKPLLALYQYGSPEVFELAYSKVLANKQADLVKEAYEKGKAEKQLVQSSLPKVEGSSVAAPAPVHIPMAQRLAQGVSIDAVLRDEAYMTESEKKFFNRR